MYTKPKPVAIKIPATFKYALKPVSYTIKNNWWENFDNPQLNNLVNETLKNNLNYKIAMDNIQIAKTYVSQNEAALFPQISLNYSLSKNQSSATIPGQTNTNIYNLYQIGVNASYEVDIWHQIANTINEAQSNVSVSREDANVIKLSLLSSVSQTYFQLCALSKNIENLKEQYSINQKILNFYKDQYESGIINLVPIEDEKVILEDIKSDLTGLEKIKTINQNALAYYLGKYPEDFTFFLKNKNFDNMDYTKLIPANLPSEILIQRPDVKSALYNVYSYAYAQKASLANFFPQFSLTGSDGFESDNLSQFISSASNVWSFGLNLLAPLFNYQGNISKYKRAKIQYKQAVYNYRNTVINAFSETDNALASYKKDFEALSTYQNNYLYAKKIFNIYAVQYRGGIIDPITYLTYKLNLLNAQYNLINQNLLLKEDIISIYNALGMGLGTNKKNMVE